MTAEAKEPAGRDEAAEGLLSEVIRARKPAWIALLSWQSAIVLVCGVLVLAAWMVFFLRTDIRVPVVSGAVAVWHMDEGRGGILKDSSGGDSDGIIHGARWVKGRFGRALAFDGVDDYIDLDLQVANLDFDAPASIVMWFMPGNDSTGPGNCLYNLFNSAEGDWDRGFLICTGNLTSAVADEQVNIIWSAPNFTHLYYSAPIALWTADSPAWHQLVVTLDGSRTRAYLDGRELVLKLRNTPSQFGKYGDGIRADTARIGMAFHPDGPGTYYKGLLDEVTICNRALSAWEVQALYEQVERPLSPYGGKTVVPRPPGSYVPSRSPAPDAIPAAGVADGKGPALASENLPIPEDLERFMVREQAFAGGKSEGAVEFIEADRPEMQGLGVRHRIRCDAGGNRPKNCPWLYPGLNQYGENPRHFTDTDGFIWIPVDGTWKQKWGGKVWYLERTGGPIGLKGRAPGQHEWSEAVFLVVRPDAVAASGSF